VSKFLDASVIICAYTDDRWADLVAAIDSVRMQQRPARANSGGL
jgi:hypothetical protein